MGSARAKAVGVAVSLALLGAVCTASDDARAGTDVVSGTGKGIVGGALIGGEIGFLGLSAFGARQSWLYYTVPTALAIGGGVGGYFIEQNTDPHVPVYMLAGGMALIIPTIVVTLSANAYTPGSEDATPVDVAPAAEGGAKVDASAPSTGTGSAPSSPGAGTSTTTPPAAPQHKPAKDSMRLRRPLPLALVNVGENASSLQFSVPAVSIKPMYTQTEIAMYGVQQKYQVNAPLVAVAF